MCYFYIWFLLFNCYHSLSLSLFHEDDIISFHILYPLLPLFPFKAISLSHIHYCLSLLLIYFNAPPHSLLISPYSLLSFTLFLSFILLKIQTYIIYSSISFSWQTSLSFTFITELLFVISLPKTYIKLFVIAPLSSHHPPSRSCLSHSAFVITLLLITGEVETS